jgi:FKBP-type peptidyl-prolyl cis-trans isomerase
MRTAALAGALLVALTATACRSFDPERRPLHVDFQEVRTEHGVVFEELATGDGPEAVLGDEILVDYVVSLPDGTRVDSTLDRGVPVPIVLGEAFVKGLDEGLSGIRAQGRRKITVPAELAYGEKGVEDLVPANSPLVFEVHAIEVRKR